MLIYDKNDKSIDIYSIQAKKEELKKFRKKVLQQHKNESLFYCLRTNCEETIKRFNTATDSDIRCLIYDNATPLDVGTWSNIYEMGELSYEKQTQEDILQKYIDGEYTSLMPTRVFEFIREDDLDCEVFRFLKPEKERISSQNSHGYVWEMKNMINLPKNLYLLHLLEHGAFAKLTSENITRQLQLFDIDYLRTVNVSDIQDMIATGLVGGTIEYAINKAEVGSKILEKAKKKK